MNGLINIQIVNDSVLYSGKKKKKKLSIIMNYM